MISGFVKGLGCVPVEADNGHTALAVLDTTPDVDLLITDVMMPKVDGSELVKLLRNRDGCAEFPVILTSGIVDATDVGDLLLSDFATFIPKPVNAKVLAGAIQQYFPAASLV